jgi:hypothetical protein
VEGKVKLIIDFEGSKERNLLQKVNDKFKECLLLSKLRYSNLDAEVMPRLSLKNIISTTK